MSENILLFSKTLDKNSLKDSLHKKMKYLSPINHPKNTINKVSIDCNIPKDNIKNDDNSFKSLKIPIKKCLSIDRKYKFNSFQIINKKISNNKIVINCINESETKEILNIKNGNLNFIGNNWGITSNDVSPLVNINRGDNYFNNQYKRPSQHCKSLKMEQNKGLINEIQNYLNNNKIQSKFQSNKKGNKPISFLNNDNNNKKLAFTNLAFKKEEKQLKLIDFDNSIDADEKSEDHSSEVEDHDKNSEENIKKENEHNNSKNSCSDNEKHDNKLVIKSQFKIDDENILKEITDEKDIDNEKLNENELKPKKDNNDKNNQNHNDLIKSKKKGYRYSMQQNVIPLLNKKIIISSVITKSGICDEEEKINQDSYLIRENIFNEDFYLYGIFDGHGDNGHLISRFISKYINDFFLNIKNYIDNNDYLSTFNKDNIKKLFLEKKEKIINKCQNSLDSDLNTKINFDISLSGSTSLLLFLIEETLICANVGDSECFIFKCSNEDMWTYESLSKTHKPTDDEEKKRILENGGEIHPYYDQDGFYEGPDRIYVKGKTYPGLSLSRSIGDLEGKKIGIISKPEIIIKRIEENHKFIIMGSDGLWNVIKPYDANRMVRPYFNKGDIDGACKVLLKKAEAAWKKNNEERDDITIIIIFIGKPNIYLKKENNNLLGKVEENPNEASSINESTKKIPLLLNLD